MTRWLIPLGILLALGASGCASLQEGTLLHPTRERPVLGLRLRVSPAEGLPQAVLGTRARILRVVLVRPGQPADLAGVLPGDVILELNGQPVSGMEDSVAILQTRDWGDTIVLTIVRDGQLQTIAAALTRQPWSGSR